MWLFYREPKQDRHASTAVLCKYLLNQWKDKLDIIPNCCQQEFKQARLLSFGTLLLRLVALDFNTLVNQVKIFIIFRRCFEQFLCRLRLINTRKKQSCLIEQVHIGLVNFSIVVAVSRRAAVNLRSTTQLLVFFLSKSIFNYFYFKFIFINSIYDFFPYVYTFINNKWFHWNKYWYELLMIMLLWKLHASINNSRINLSKYAFHLSMHLQNLLLFLCSWLYDRKTLNICRILCH